MKLRAWTIHSISVVTESEKHCGIEHIQCLSKIKGNLPTYITDIIYHWRITYAWIIMLKSVLEKIYYK